MSKKEFIKRWNKDFTFRVTAMAKGIRVIQENVFFFNPDGTLKSIAGKYIV